MYDFVFNGWGMKFAANLDNLVTRNLSVQGTFAGGVQVINMQPFVLEGGSIESDGKGTLLTIGRMSFVSESERISAKRKSWKPI